MGFIHKVTANIDFTKLEKYLKKDLEEQRKLAETNKDANKHINALGEEYKTLLAGVKKANLETELMDFIKEAHIVSQEEQLDLFDELDPKLKKLLKDAHMMSPFGVDPRIHQWFHNIWTGQSPH
jgi:hypothetical protein